MSEALAAAVGLGLNKIGGAIASRGQHYGALNEIALTAHTQAQLAQQGHEHRLAELGAAHGFNMQHLEAQNTFTAGQNALDRAHQASESSFGRAHEASENALNRKTELAKGRLEGRNKLAQINAGHTNALNATQFALDQSKKGAIAPGSAVKIHEHGIDFKTPLAPTPPPKKKRPMPKPSRGRY